MQKLKVLLVYETIPESTDIYDLEVDSEDWEWMQKTHGRYLNYEMSAEAEEACNKLSEYLPSKDNCKVFAGGDKPIGMDKPLAGTSYDYIIHTGFGM